MTEQEWLTSAEPKAMLYYLAGGSEGLEGERSLRKVSDRKLLLWIAACYDASTYKYGTPGYLKAFREGILPSDYRATVLEEAQAWCNSRIDMVGDPSLAVRAALLRDIIGNPFRPVTLPPGEQRQCWSCQGYGNHLGAGPDRGNPECYTCNGTGKLAGPSPWLTPTVLAIAQRCYDERAFDGLLILADALEDAGCENEDLLLHLRGEWGCDHCQGAGIYYEPPYSLNRFKCPHCDMGLQTLTHVRGCWALDLILGKE